jgi:hypothetical protein
VLEFCNTHVPEPATDAPGCFSLGFAHSMVFRDERSPRLYFRDRIGDHGGLFCGE